MSSKDINRLSRNVHCSLRSCTFLFDLSRVVEELVYNSLDAGSTRVLVSLSVRSYFAKVDDDGCGITRDGLAILGERYATSKAPLMVNGSTETLGFRGEALSSISDLSLLEIRSKARGKPNAYCKIVKSSRCLFFGIDDQREDVGTTVIVRELFFNQPIRRKFMQSCLKKALHSVKKCVFRIALVHPHVSFKVFEIEEGHRLLCTSPFPSSLPLVTEGFGNEVSSLLREFSYSAQESSLSGYISGPTDAISTKVFQYIYINGRFICKGSIHNLINSLATSFQFSIANWKDNSENHRKRQKAQGYPAFLLNLSCPVTSYDISFEPSKARVEFKDWRAILSFFEQAIIPYWEQTASNQFSRGEGAAGEASFQENEVLREVNSLQGAITNCKQSDFINYKRSGLHHSPLAVDSIECTAGSDWYNNCLHRGDNFIFEKNISSSLHINKNAHQSAIGVLRNCQKWRQQDAASFDISPSHCENAFLTGETSFNNQKITECADNDSELSGFDFAKMWGPPKFQDIVCDSTFVEKHYTQDFDCKHYAIEEKNAKFVDTVLSDSDEALPDLIRASSNAVDHNLFSSPMKYHQYEFPSYQSTATNGDSISPCNKKMCYLQADFFSIRNADIFNTSPVKFTEHDAIKSSFKNKGVKLRRSHSAPPFYKGRKKFPILNCLSTDNARKKYLLCPSHIVNHEGLNCQQEPFSAQPSLMLIDELKQTSIMELKKNIINQKGPTTMHSFEEFDCGSVPHKGDPTSMSLTKWRTENRYHDGVLPHKSDVLNISSGILHRASSLLVPTSINKDCFETATRVLLQLDCKFIPVIANGILAIIDQHAADERIRLEELRKKVLHGEFCSTTYLNPEHELALPDMGYQLLLKYAEKIKKWGWIYRINSQCSESFTRSMNFLRQHKSGATLVAVPHILGTDLTGKDLLEYIEQLIETDGSCVIPPAVIHILNYKACRGAVMFGDALLPSECSLIVEELKATSLCFQCAHGRPTTVPLLNISALHEQLSRLDGQDTCQSGEWHGLCRHTPSIHRAQQRLELC